MSDAIFIRMRDLGICFEIEHNGGVTLRSKAIAWLRRKQLPVKRIQALRGVNLDIERGERIGLIGRNGAGKSTLLKVMARIYPPNAGEVEVSGHVCPLFSFATGFEMELSGWENIRIRGMLLGMSRKEIEAKLPDIAAFSELGEFLDYPVRTYSSGMVVRLAFAISTAINPQILLLDEVMGAGDIGFASKAKKRMRELIDEGQIVVIASHAMPTIRDFCTRTIWLDRGRVKMFGPSDEVTAAYEQFVQEETEQAEAAEAAERAEKAEQAGPSDQGPPPGRGCQPPQPNQDAPQVPAAPDSPRPTP